MIQLETSNRRSPMDHANRFDCWSAAARAAKECSPILIRIFDENGREKQIKSKSGIKAWIARHAR